MKFLLISIFFVFLSLVFYPIVVLGGLLTFLSRKINYKNFHGKIGFFPLFNKKSSINRENNQYLWVHLSSLGEWNTAKVFIKELGENLQHPILITYFNQDLQQYIENTSKNGSQDNKSLGLPEKSIAFFLPIENIFSFYWIIKHYQTIGLVIVETEIWPILILINKWMNKKIFLVNATLFEKEANNYAKLKFLFSPLINCFNKIYCVSQNSKENFLSLGMDNPRITIEKNFKYDFSSKITPNSDLDSILELLKKSGKNTQKYLITLASFHFEEIKKVFPQIKQFFSHPNYGLVVVPRDINSIHLWEEFFSKENISIIKKTQLSQNNHEKLNSLKLNKENIQNLLLDTYGEQPNVFKHSDLVIMGGTFIPIGGHNFLEAIFFNKPVILGTSTHHFRDFVDDFREFLYFSDKDHLGTVIKDFFNEPEKLKKDNGFNKLNQFVGISKKISLELTKELAEIPNYKKTSNK